MRDADDFLDAWRGLQRFQFSAMFVAFSYDSNHGSLLAAAQMRLKTALLNALHDVVNLLFRCVYIHVDDHCIPLEINLSADIVSADL